MEFTKLIKLSASGEILLDQKRSSLDIASQIKRYIQMPEDSKDIYKSGIIEKCIDGPTIGKFLALRNLCFSEFATMYHKKKFYGDNDFQSIYQIP